MSATLELHHHDGDVLKFTAHPEGGLLISGDDGRGLAAIEDAHVPREYVHDIFVLLQTPASHERTVHRDFDITFGVWDHRLPREPQGNPGEAEDTREAGNIELSVRGNNNGAWVLGSVHPEQQDAFLSLLEEAATPVRQADPVTTADL